MRTITLCDHGDEKLEVLDKIECEGEVTYIIRRTEYPENWGDDAQSSYGNYYVSIICAGPYWVQGEALESCLRSYGMSEDEYNKLPDYGKLQVLIGYGTYATIFSASGNNIRKLKSVLRNDVGKLRMLFGFYLDRAQNAIGSSGWDFMSGNLTAGLKK